MSKHVDVHDEGTVIFDYPAKSGHERVQSIADSSVVDAFERGDTIGPTLDGLGVSDMSGLDTRGQIERAVLVLLDEQ